MPDRPPVPTLGLAGLALLSLVGCAPGTQGMTTLNARVADFFAPTDATFLFGGRQFAEDGPFPLPGPPPRDVLRVYGAGGGAPSGQFSPSVGVGVPGSLAVDGDEEVLCLYASASAPASQANYMVFQPEIVGGPRNGTSFLLRFGMLPGVDADIVFGRDGAAGRAGFRPATDDLAFLTIRDGEVFARHETERGINLLPLGNLPLERRRRDGGMRNLILATSFDETEGTCEVSGSGIRRTGPLPDGYCNVGATLAASMAIRIGPSDPEARGAHAMCVTSATALAILTR